MGRDGQGLACRPDMLAPHYNFVISWIIVLPLYIICFSLFIKLTALWHAEYFKQVTFYASRDRSFSFFVLPWLVINSFISTSYFLLVLEVILRFVFVLHICVFWFFGFVVPKHTFWLCHVIRFSHYSVRAYLSSIHYLNHRILTQRN